MITGIKFEKLYSREVDLTRQISNRFMEDLETLAKLKDSLPTENKELASRISEALNTKIPPVNKSLSKAKGLNR